MRPFPAMDRSFGPIAAGEDVRINLPGDQNSSKRHDERCRVREVEVDCLGVLFEGALLSSIQRMAVTTYWTRTGRDQHMQSHGGKLWWNTVWS